ncbi:hypothetical protein [Caulobacter sp. RHG1]|uniref:hypothetical protein n=1 Tax=Caulobacter sp. (strain RHG1) TaxID=2545762 RepID=UPI001554A86C|nr:hypothetical protein [Caulobacter sp. RHG1]NQE64400.1 hypothetical protein [Caulobacter sp. RHG1]
MRKIILAGVFAALSTSAAIAQTAPGGPPANTIFVDNITAGGYSGSQRLMNVPQINYTEEARLRAVRARAAAGLIRDGRCGDAARLAHHQRDEAMVQRIGEVCSTAAHAPTPPA